MRVTEPYTIFLRTLASGRQVYYYQYRDSEGRRSPPRSTGCTSMSAARRFCQKLYNGGGFSVPKDGLFCGFVKDFLAEDGDFRAWRRANGKDLKPETVRRYELSLQRHILPYFGKMEMRRITRDVCKKWVVWAAGQWSPKTVNNAQGVLNLVFDSAVEKGIMQRNPLYHLGMRRTEKKRRVLLTIGELRAVYGTVWPNEKERKAFLLAAVTGMRIGEVVALRAEDVRNGYVDVSHDVSERYGLQTTKTGIRRFVPVPAGFGFPESGSEWLFEGTDGNPLRAHCVYNAFSRRCDALGIDRKGRGIDVHSLRDFFVTYLRSLNVPDPKIRAVVGHADATMTDVYTHWAPDMFPEVETGIRSLSEFATRSWILSAILLYTLIYDRSLYAQSGLDWRTYSKEARARLGLDPRDITEMLSAATNRRRTTT